MLLSRLLRTPSVTALNRIGESGLPCLTPRRTRIELPIVPCTVLQTCLVQVVEGGNVRKHQTRNASRAAAFSMECRDAESNALATSTNVTKSGLVSERKSQTLSARPSPLVKAFCRVDSGKSTNNRLARILWNALEIIEEL